MHIKLNILPKRVSYFVNADVRVAASSAKLFGREGDVISTSKDLAKLLVSLFPDVSSQSSFICLFILRLSDV